jgi:hypothetical protein
MFRSVGWRADPPIELSSMSLGIVADPLVDWRSSPIRAVPIRFPGIPVGARQAIADLPSASSLGPLERTITAKLRPTAGFLGSASILIEPARRRFRGGPGPLKSSRPFARRRQAESVAARRPTLRRRQLADPNNGSGRKTGAALVNRQSQMVLQRQPKGVGRRT